MAALLAANPGLRRNPNLLRVGDEIAIPQDGSYDREAAEEVSRHFFAADAADRKMRAEAAAAQMRQEARELRKIREEMVNPTSGSVRGWGTLDDVKATFAVYKLQANAAENLTEQAQLIEQAGGKAEKEKYLKRYIAANSGNVHDKFDLNSIKHLSLLDQAKIIELQQDTRTNYEKVAEEMGGVRAFVASAGGRAKDYYLGGRQLASLITGPNSELDDELREHFLAKDALRTHHVGAAFSGEAATDFGLSLIGARWTGGASWRVRLATNSVEGTLFGLAEPVHPDLKDFLTEKLTQTLVRAGTQAVVGTTLPPAISKVRGAAASLDQYIKLSSMSGLIDDMGELVGNRAIVESRRDATYLLKDLPIDHPMRQMQAEFHSDLTSRGIRIVENTKMERTIAMFAADAAGTIDSFHFNPLKMKFAHLVEEGHHGADLPLLGRRLSAAEIEIKGKSATFRENLPVRQKFALARDIVRVKNNDYFNRGAAGGVLYAIDSFAETSGGKGRFSAFDVESNLHRRIYGLANDEFSLHYTSSEIKGIFQSGVELGLEQRTIEDLMFVGSRVKKPITAQELVTQMDNYVNVVKKRGYPYKFDDRQAFESFSAGLKNILREGEIPTTDVRIQGSSLRTPHAKDIDIAVFTTEQQFDILAKRMIQGIRDRAGPVAAEKIVRDLERQAADGRINSYYFDRKLKNDPTFNQKMRELDKHMINSGGTDLSLILYGKNFDVKPYLGV
ncbi:hypothetical protein [Chitinimonas lacunae]